MAGSGFGLRSAIEYSAVLVVIYLLLGGDKIQSFFRSDDLDRITSDEHQTSQEKIDSLVYPDRSLQCPPHHYDVHIFSHSPLIIYVDNFLSAEENKHLIDISADKWTPSTTYHGSAESIDASVRLSEKALLPRDQTVQCIESRALDFQGWPVDTHIEKLWTQRYNVSGHYAHHYDWGSSSAAARRSTTFMVYLQADCEGGGTNFPLLQRPQDKRWCEFVSCDDEGMAERGEQGVTFLPRAGAAVFWENFGPDGRGWKEGLHAGLAVTKGTKIGLNIWSWYQRGHHPGELP